MLALPTKPAYALLSGDKVFDNRSSAADAVPVLVLRVCASKNCFVWNGFNETNSEERH